jgi:hypothetical protein
MKEEKNGPIDGKISRLGDKTVKDARLKESLQRK